MVKRFLLNGNVTSKYTHETQGYRIRQAYLSYSVYNVTYQRQRYTQSFRYQV